LRTRAALVSIGKHFGMFTDQVQVRAQYGISDKRGRISSTTREIGQMSKA
jgi:hypothetical protein